MIYILKLLAPNHNEFDYDTQPCENKDNCLHSQYDLFLHQYNLISIRHLYSSIIELTHHYIELQIFQFERS